MEFKHFSHNHGLVFNQLPQGFHCSGCKSPGSGNVYVCWQCSYFLHEQCFRASRSLKHPSHPLHHSTLMPSPTYQSCTFLCNSCNLDGHGFSYSCADCDFDVHVHCALMPNANPHVSLPPTPAQNSIYPPIKTGAFPISSSRDERVESTGSIQDRSEMAMLEAQRKLREERIAHKLVLEALDNAADYVGPSYTKNYYYY